MGLSLHYKGSLTDKRQLNPLVEELEDIANSLQWKARVFDEPWDQKPDARLEQDSMGKNQIVGNLGLKGITLYPHPECEPIYFCFSASGVMTSPVQVALSAADGYPVTPTWISVKTQFAGPNIHVAIIKLLRYLSGKYLHDLEVEDEGGYWATGDYEEMVRRMGFLQEGIEALARQAATLKRRDEADIVAQIEQLLRKMRDREED